MAIEIREHLPGKDIADFMRVSRVVYAGDPNWVEPLSFDLKARLTPGKNPFFHRGELALFTAWKDGKLAGRISAQIDHEHLKRYGDKTGFFGFFDAIDDDEVGAALVEKARAWLEARGMKTMRGPLSLTMYEEVGTLIDDYTGRVARYAKFREVEVADDGEVAAAITRAVPKRARVVALEVEGERMSSEKLAVLVERARGAAVPALVFLIGGAYGLPKEISAAAHTRLSLSDLTLPHRLARLVLVEQIYRAFTIQRGEPYSH